VKANALVCGAGGFIGSHLVKRLVAEGVCVVGADLKLPEFSATVADQFFIGDLCSDAFCEEVFAAGPFDEVYQLAADMGGAGFVFTGLNDAAIMSHSARINLNVLECCRKYQPKRIFFASSACIYPEFNQTDPANPVCEESTAYPAQPDSEYGWEKLFSERLYLAYAKNHSLQVKIARFHNIFGPEGTWDGGREKAPAAVCRKIAAAKPGGAIEIWGDGQQTRSFLYITECLEGVRRLMDSSFSGPVNIGSQEMVTINELVSLVQQIAGKEVSVLHIPGPQGVRGRCSDNRLIEARLGWKPSMALATGLATTYDWIAGQLMKM
jgi:nucleoside-diphosphate-sugar epimerase